MNSCQTRLREARLCSLAVKDHWLVWYASVWRALSGSANRQSSSAQTVDAVGVLKDLLHTFTAGTAWFWISGFTDGDLVR